LLGTKRPTSICRFDLEPLDDKGAKNFIDTVGVAGGGGGTLNDVATVGCGTAGCVIGDETIDTVEIVATASSKMPTIVADIMQINVFLSKRDLVIAFSVNKSTFIQRSRGIHRTKSPHTTCRQTKQLQQIIHFPCTYDIKLHPKQTFRDRVPSAVNANHTMTPPTRLTLLVARDSPRDDEFKGVREGE
jgi:hypothetical protein